MKLSLPKISIPKIEVPKITIGKDLGMTNISNAASKAVKDVGTAGGKALGDTVSQIGRTVGSKDLVKVGGNVTAETKRGMKKIAPLLTQLAASTFIPGYGLYSGLSRMSSSGRFDLGELASMAGSAAGLNPAAVKAIQGGSALAKGDLRGAALAGLGSLGTGGGQSFLSGLTGGAGSSLTNPNTLRMLSSAVSGDRAGLASSLGGAFGFGDNTSNLLGSIAANDKKGIAGSLGGALGLSDNMSRALGGAITGDARNIGMGLLGASDLIDPNRFRALDDLSGGKLTMDNARTAFGGLLPSMGMGGEDGGDSGGSSWLDSLQNLGAGFSTSGLTPEALKGLSTSGLLPYSTSGILPDFGSGSAEDKGRDNVASIKNFFGDIFGGGGGERMPAGEGAPEEGGFFDSIGEGFNDFTTGVGNFVGGNRGALGLGADALTSYLAYERGRKGFDTARGISEDQLRDLSGAGEGYAKVAYDPERYKQERDFISQRILGGGITAQEKQMQQQGDLRAARAAAAARAAGVEQMVRMGQGVSGAGSSLASALAGGQSVMGVQSEANLAREASASERLERDIQRQTNLSRQQTQEEADLERLKMDARLNQLQQMGSTRGDIAKQELDKAKAEQAMYLEGANTIKTGLNTYESPEERQERLRQQALSDTKNREQEAYARRLREAQLAKAEREAGISREPSSSQQPPVERTTYTLPADIKDATDRITQPSKPPQARPTPKPLPNPTLPTQSQVTGAINKGTYQIGKGDTLSKIYKNLGYNTWRELYDANKDLIGDNPDKIKAGATLRKKSEIGKPSASRAAFNTVNRKSTGNIA